MNPHASPWPAAAAAMLLVLAPAQPGAWQGPAQAPIVVETVQVNVVNVDVFVTDRDGRSVAGLASEDFEVLEDGKPVAITNFYASLKGRPAAAAKAEPAQPPREPQEQGATTPDEQALRVIFFVDNANLTLVRRNAIFEQVRTLLREGLRGGRTEALMATSGGAVRIRQPFTSDEQVLLAMVDKLEGEVGEARLSANRNPVLSRMMGNAASAAEVGAPSASGALSSDSDMEDALAVREQVRAAAEEAYQRTRVTVAAMTQFVDSLAGLPGRKALVYVGEGVPMRPAEALFAEWQASMGRFDPTFSAISEASQYTVNREFQDMIRRANAARVTFYCIDASADPSGTSPTAEQAAPLADPSTSVMSAHDLRQSLENMAGATGGRTLVAGPKLASALADTVQDLQTYYSLGYEAPHIGDGKYHSIKVRVKREGASVRHREGYLDKGPDERTAERNLSALLFDATSNTLGVAVSVSPAEKQKDGNLAVTVTVTVPLGNLVFLPREEVHEGSVSMWVATRDAGDRLSAPGKQTFPVRIPNTQLQTALGQTGSFTFKMLVRRGQQRVAVTLRDELGQTDSTAVATFTADEANTGAAGPT
jgi:VWFA-related protein